MTPSDRQWGERLDVGLAPLLKLTAALGDTVRIPAQLAESAARVAREVRP